MGCIYSDFHGKCTLFDEDYENPGWDENGNCICEDDPDPSYLCGDYESSYGDECDCDDNCDCEDCNCH